LSWIERAIEMIEVIDLKKKFGDVAAVDGVNFTVERGEILGFLGPNAAGKTTTMRMLTCFLPPSSGTARIGGYDIFDDSLQVRKRVGYLPEQVPLYSDMRVQDYLEFVTRVKGVPHADRKGAIDHTMGKCGLTSVKKRIIGTLSKGFRQRVGLAQALAGNPDVLILDEPTTGLDPRQIIEIRQLIKELGLGHTVILSTHILPEVSMICDRVIIINKGKLVASDSVENLTKMLTKSQMTLIEVLGDENEVKKSMKRIDGVLAVEKTREQDQTLIGQTYVVHAIIGNDIRQEIARKLVKDGLGLLRMQPHILSLEDIFLKLTMDEDIKGVADKND
jgi:ABC-2 type transport system ATP-binding protein